MRSRDKSAAGPTSFRLIRILRIFRVLSVSVKSYGFRRKVSWVRRIATEGGCGDQNGYEKKYGWILAVFFFPSSSSGCSVLPLASNLYGARAFYLERAVLPQEMCVLRSGYALAG